MFKNYLIGRFQPHKAGCWREFRDVGWTQFYCIANEKVVLVIHGSPDGDLCWPGGEEPEVSPELIICCHPRRVREKWGDAIPQELYNEGWDGCLAGMVFHDDSLLHVYAVLEEEDGNDDLREMYRRWYPEHFD